MIVSHQRGRGKKIHLFIDDEYTITTDCDLWADYYIKDGSDISQEKWEEIVDAINYKKALDKAFDLLSRRDHSEKELRTKLLKTSDEINVEKVINRMYELHYLDDEKYAERLVEYCVKNKKLSRSFVKQELYKRGIPSDIITNVMEDFEFDNADCVFKLLNGKYRNKILNEDDCKKTVSSLMRKGFSYSDIRKAFDRLENEELSNDQ